LGWGARALAFATLIVANLSLIFRYRAREFRMKAIAR
jgi:hypothetical protein